MRKHYENFFNSEQATNTEGCGDQRARVESARANFRPMYYIKQYPEDMTKLEMCFDCTNYQAQFPPEVDFDNHIFQTIYLNKQRDGHLWSDNEIDESKIIRKDWWHQLCHSWTHYVFVVPWLWLLQGRRHTRFASSWTVVNAHEVAIISGLAAAVDLGAAYPEDLERDGFALFYLRGIAPPSVKSSDIYWGAIPWVILQLLLVVILIFWPGSVTYWLDKGTGVDPSTIKIDIPQIEMPELDFRDPGKK